jgi:hypothetical protein
LKVWQKLYKLCLELYRITAKFPKEEKYGLTSQGCFIYLNGSVCELETQILSAGDLDLIEKGVLGKQKKDIADESGAKFEH